MRRESFERPERSEVSRLGRLFREHPVWREAARTLDTTATSDVYFRSFPGEVRFARRHGIAGLGDLRRLVAKLLEREPAPWERNAVLPG